MNVNLEEIKKYLKTYNGPELNIMEVCGSHTGAIAKNGIPGLMSDRIHLISGPGCPVCVTPSSYIDRLIELCLTPGICVVTFGDLLRVPGSAMSLQEAKGRGGRVQMVYSPMDIFPMAEQEPETVFVFAAVGFETTQPVYALMVRQIVEDGVPNVKLLTALRTMPEAIDSLCAAGADIQGFLAPGHVAVVTGSKAFEPLASKYSLPFAVAGFTGAEILAALYGIVKACERGSDRARLLGEDGGAEVAPGGQKAGTGRGCVMNFYPSVVSREGNTEAQKLMEQFFEKSDAAWRGMGIIPGSGKLLKPEFAHLDMGSADLTADHKINKGCCCDKVLTGRMKPTQCPLFGKVCSPLRPQGACMVSAEGNCYTYYVNRSH